MYKILIALLSTLPFSALAVEEYIPDFISLKKHEVNVRAGPGTQYPILWVYKRQSYPLEVLAKYEGWYKIRDAEKEEGWVYRTLISKRRTTLISTGTPVTLYKNAEGSEPLLRLSPQVILSLEKCTPIFCQVSYRGTEGWILKERLLMVEKHED